MTAATKLKTLGHLEEIMTAPRQYVLSLASKSLYSPETWFPDCHMDVRRLDMYLAEHQKN